jgi:1,2-diacylglycerol 3-beta-glucosyltransferase
MPTGEGASGTQRRRWEGGRFQLARRQALPLLLRGLATRDRVLVDLAVDLLVPPLAYLGALIGAGTVAAALGSWHAGRPLVALWLWGATCASLAGYVWRGWWLSGTGLRGLGGLLYAPVYLVWKLGLALGRPGHARGAWVRTQRERGPP